MVQFTGTAGADYVQGTEGDDIVGGGDGNDVIFTYGGNDQVEGEGGADYIVGGNGNDTLDGGEGDDEVSGLDGDDTIRGGNGRDRLSGGAGSDDIAGGAGNDTIDGDTSVGQATGGNDRLFGGDGNDLISGNGGDDVIEGGAGVDEIRGGAGRDTIDGGAGDDFLSGFGEEGYGVDTEVDTVFGGDGNDRITLSYGDSADGGAGTDSVSLFLYNAPIGITADFRQLTNNGTIQIGGGTLTNLEHVNYLSLTNFDDTIVAGIGPADPNGLFTRLIIDGFGGNDRLTGSDARDMISGGDGDDVITGGVGYNAQVYPGGDRLSGDRGNDIIHGGVDESLISGGEGDDRIFGGSGSEEATGDNGDDRLEMGAGNDGAQGGAGRDVLIGGSGDDTLVGGDGEDELNGGDGNDTLLGGNNDVDDDEVDVLSGGDGDDLITASFGDTVIGGAGRDTLSLYVDPAAATQGLTLDFSGQETGSSLSIGTGTVSGIETVGTLALTDEDDTIVLGFQTADAGGFIDGRDGDDRLTGSVQDESLFGGAGNDVLNGGDGTDYLDGHLGNDVLDGGDGDDVLSGDIAPFTPGNDRLFGRAGNDTLIGGGGKDELDGGDGDDILTAHLYTFSSSSDGSRMDGGAGRDFLSGDGGNDVLNGGDGDDMLVTGASFNVVRQDAGYTFNFFGTDSGNDTIDGGEGDDLASLFYGERAAGITLDNSTPDTVNTIFSGGAAASTITRVERIEFVGGSGKDEITGGALRDILYGGSGNDRLRGGGGNDILNGGAGDDILDGGAGSNTASWFLTAANVDLNQQGVAQDTGHGLDTLIGIENLQGNIGSDRFIGNAADNVLFDPVGGDDRFFGGGGNDTITITRAYAGPSVVELHGEDGADILTFDGSARHVDTALLSGGSGADTITASGARSAVIAAGDGDDRVTVDQAGGLNAVTLGSGSDTLVLVHVETSLSSGWSIDVADFATGAGGDALELSGFISSDALEGYAAGSNPFAGGFLRLVQAGASAVLQFDKDGGGDDFSTLVTFRSASVAAFGAANLGGFETLPTVAGTNGADRLTGGAGNQRLEGGGGDDQLTGGPGDDLLDGGAGRDSAVFAAAFRQTSISVTSGGTIVVGSEGTDTATGVERFQFVDGTYVVDPDSAGAQVQRLYDTVLGRAPDAVGLDYWVDQMEDVGVGLGQVAIAIASSPEFQAAAGGLGNAAFVDYIYGRALGRAPDEGGRDYWAGRLDAGLSRGDMLVNFSESGEHRIRTADPVGRGYFQTDDDAQAVALLYDSFTGRRPDAGGLAFWTGQLQSGAYTLSQVADAFAASTEFQNAVRGKTSAELVDLLYANTLDRAPDGGGRAYWVDQLDRGLTQGQILLGFAQSAEHAQLLAAQIVYGIDVPT